MPSSGACGESMISWPAAPIRSRAALESRCPRCVLQSLDIAASTFGTRPVPAVVITRMICMRATSTWGARVAMVWRTTGSSRSGTPSRVALLT